MGSGIWLLLSQRVKGCAGAKSHNLFISSDYPNLYQMALDYLIIPGTFMYCLKQDID